MQDTRTPVVVGVIAMSLNIGLSILLGAFFQRIGWLPIGGLALANSIATGLEAIVLLIIMRKRLCGLEGAKIFKLIWKVLLAVVVMGGFLWWVVNYTGLSNVLILLFGIAFGLILYVLSLLVLRVEDFNPLVRNFLRKIFHRKTP